LVKDPSTSKYRCEIEVAGFSCVKKTKGILDAFGLSDLKTPLSQVIAALNRVVSTPRIAIENFIPRKTHTKKTTNMRTSLVPEKWRMGD